MHGRTQTRAGEQLKPARWKNASPRVGGVPGLPNPGTPEGKAAPRQVPSEREEPNPRAPSVCGTHIEGPSPGPHEGRHCTSPAGRWACAAMPGRWACQGIAGASFAAREGCLCDANPRPLHFALGRAAGPQRPGSPPGRWTLRMRPAAGTSHSRSAAGTERPSAARARHNDQGIAGTGPADILPNSLTLPLLRPSVCSSTSRSRSRRRRAASHCATLRFASAARLELCCWRRSPGLLSASRCPDLPPG